MKIFNFLRKKEKEVRVEESKGIDLSIWEKVMERIAREKHEGKHKAGKIDKDYIQKIHVELSGGAEKVRERELLKSQQAEIRHLQAIKNNKIYEHVNLMKSFHSCFKYDIRSSLHNLDNVMENLFFFIERRHYPFDMEIFTESSNELEEAVKKSTIYEVISKHGKVLINNYNDYNYIFAYIFILERVKHILTEIGRLKMEKAKEKRAIKLKIELTYAAEYVKSIGATSDVINRISILSEVVNRKDKDICIDDYLNFIFFTASPK